MMIIFLWLQQNHVNDEIIEEYLFKSNSDGSLCNLIFEIFENESFSSENEMSANE